MTIQAARLIVIITCLVKRSSSRNHLGVQHGDSGPDPGRLRDGIPVFAAGGFEPVRDFDRSQGDRFVQQNDKATGAPLWAVEVIDADPQARARTVKIKVASAQQPVLPPAQGGAPFVPVEFTGLTVTPYVNQAGRLAYSVKATGVRQASRHGSGRPLPDGKETAA